MKGKPTIHWDCNPKRYENFTDLNHYIIQTDEISENQIEDALSYIGSMYDGWNGGCSACAKRNDQGDVVIGRNLDMLVSQVPCFIVPTSFGKYQAIHFVSDPAMPCSYEELLRRGRLEDDFYHALPFLCGDCFNEAGLYIECNTRPQNIELSNSGTHPGKERAGMIMICGLVGTHCATVKEAVEFLKESYDFYTTNYENIMISHCNFAFLMGDAQGEFGLVEIAENKVNYIPYQYGHANYYQTPKWNAMQKVGWGYGRLQAISRGLNTAKDEVDMLKLMNASSWEKTAMYVENAYRDEAGKIHFVDDDGNPCLDWRTDYEQYFPVDESGKLAEVPELSSAYMAYCKAYGEKDKAEMSKNEEGYLNYLKHLNRCNGSWVLADENFEALQNAVSNYLENGKVKAACRKFLDGDEDTLRDIGMHWLSNFSFGVNCGKKHLLLRFWQKEELKLEYQW